MSDIQDSKSVVLEYFDAVEVASPESLADVIGKYTAPGYSFRGVHPFNELEGHAEVAARVWGPLRESFTSLQRRQDIFMAGPNLVDGTMWVTSMGKFMGLHDNN
ncbi:MAG: nuclear transport factor 2 family protein, partial [Gammaproteobacteria bacterium]|nr:nuclear transport factor 2 family protein [Gammaproteobacteria bacterium]